MSEKISTPYLKQTIFDAFKDVPKGKALGARECAVLDAFGNPDDIAAARREDVEQHWWEYPDAVKRGCFDYALTYNNEDGIKFHLPAIMAALVDRKVHPHGSSNTSILHTLCYEIPGQKAPRWDSREFLPYLNSWKVRNVWQHFNFGTEQCHAIAVFLLWMMREPHHFFFVSRKEWIAVVASRHKRRVEEGNATLTLEEAVALVDEQHRIVHDWFVAGGLDLRTHIFGADIDLPDW